MGTGIPMTTTIESYASHTIGESGRVTDRPKIRRRPGAWRGGTLAGSTQAAC